MDQNQNSPNQNQNQNQNTPPQNAQMGFGSFSRMLHEGMMMSPILPNQRSFTPTQSPPIHFHQIQQNFNPHGPYFNQNFNDPRTFLQPEFEQPNFYGGGSSQQEAVPETQEVVQETQEVPPTRKKKATRRRASTEAPQGEKIPWTDEELVALADAWCTTSLDEVRGNDQKSDSYWSHVRAKFAQTVGKPENYRTVDSLSSKWTQMKLKLTKFNGVYMKLARNLPSGWNEIKLLAEAHTMYKNQNRQIPFLLQNVWDRIRNERKWLDLPDNSSQSSGSKRSHQDLENSMGSDAHVQFDLNENEEDEENIQQVDPLHSRPPRGRDKAKRAAKFGEATEAKAKHREKIEKGLEAHLTSIAERKAERERLKARQEKMIEQQEKINEQQQRMNEQQELLNHLSIMMQGGVDEEDVEIVEEAKKSSRSWLKKMFKK